jgi:hypothetical protein
MHSLPIDCEIADFSNENLVLIDLGPIGQLSNLHTLKLDNNKILEIDLSPLAHCRKIEVLELQKNRLRNLNLDPLLNCVSLKEINISDNIIGRLNLEPLRGCKNLEWFRFHNNLIQFIDLVPLLACCNLRILKFRGNPIVCSSYYSDNAHDSKDRIECHGSHFAAIFSKTWDSLPVNKRIAYQSQFLSGLGVGVLGGFEYNLPEILSSIPAGLTSDDFVKCLWEKLVTEIDSKLHVNASTVFLDVDRISKSPAASLVPKILENRKKELNTITLRICNDIVHLDNLWLTAYGFQVLSTSEFGLQCKYSDFLEIKSSIESIGADLQVEKNIEEVVNNDISEELCEAIFTHAQLDLLSRRILRYIKMNQCEQGVSIHDINTHLHYIGHSRMEILDKISQLINMEYVVSLELGQLILGSTATSIWPM